MSNIIQLDRFKISSQKKEKEEEDRFKIVINNFFSFSG